MFGETQYFVIGFFVGLAIGTAGTILITFKHFMNETYKVYEKQIQKLVRELKKQ